MLWLIQVPGSTRNTYITVCARANSLLTMGESRRKHIDQDGNRFWQASKMEKEYPQLVHTTYLDHAGTTLYPRSAVQSFARDMTENLYGNPHSASPSSSLSTSVVEEVRNEILHRFNAPADQFDVVFVPNATAAIKLVAQAFQDQDSGFWYGYHKDAHTSLVGVRELAQNGQRCFQSDEEVESWIESKVSPPGGLGLFGYPAQSNMTGYRPPLTWGSRVRDASSFESNRTYTLLDAASYLTTGNLNLSDHGAAPDFIALSFYKIFGFPDLGALIIRRDAAPILLSRKYFGGGTVDMVLAIGDTWHQSHQEHPHEALEDGTLPFHNILALKHALMAHNILYPSPFQVANHAAILSRYAFTALKSFTHRNGTKVVTIYKDPRGQYGDSQSQGPIISLNLHNLHGDMVGKSRVEALACACDFQLRTGSLCNPGGVATKLDLRPWELRRNHSHGMCCGDELDLLGGKPTGVIRISLGAMTTQNDIEQFLDFVEFFFVCEDKLEVPKMDEETIAVPISAIQPVKGCEPLSVPDNEVESYMPWHEDWVVVDPISKREVCGHDAELRKLTVDIQPLQGKIIITHSSEKHAVGAESTALVVDLWDTNPGESRSPLKSHDSSAEESFSTDNNKIKDPSTFFTSLLGIPATLSRRSNREVLARLTPRKYVCVVWSCRRDCCTAEALADHYSLHAQDFVKRNRRALSSSRSSMKPPPNTPSKIKSMIPWISRDWNKNRKHPKHGLERKASQWRVESRKTS